ncbi:hypothetical protein HU200_027402 [Digitaria exilis]|uniref:NADP-dependent oxidoreductase domain-containing protein n=1 Tax=Digitaria exilis TaxID=1010633 RepID=A0A835BTH9_9POAL|nr:hypothetical protein HU200_027402 [Digitaria exilis]
MASPSPVESASARSPSKIPEFPVGPAGRLVPAVGLGTSAFPFQFVEEEVKAAILAALELGYRHLDTASLYLSERAVGEAVAEAARRGIVASREEVFVTTKLWCTQCHPELVLPALRESLHSEKVAALIDLFIYRNLQMEYVDLYLVHWPMAIKPSKPDFPIKREDIMPMDLSGVWQAMEECHRLGLAKMIGVSNFTTRKLKELLATANTPPAVNQVELNPSWQQQKLIEFCKEKGIHVTAYSPLGGQYRSKVLQSKVLDEIAQARGKSVAQISLRWIYEQGVSMVVKSWKHERIKENIEIFDWELTDNDRLKISQMPQHKMAIVTGILSPEGVSSVDISEVDVVEM